LTILMAGSAMLNLRPDFVSLSTADITPGNLQLYEWFSGNVGTTIRYEYLPRAVQPRLYTSAGIVYQQPMEASVMVGEAWAELLDKRTGRQRWRVQVDSESATVSFPTFYWPGWRAEVDGASVPLRPAESLGTMTLDLPAGEHMVDLKLGRTPVRWLGELLSLAALLLCLLLGKPWERTSSHRSTGKRLVIYYLLPITALFVVLQLFPAPSPTINTLTWDFDQQAFLHHNPDGVRFGGAAVMESYQFSDSQWPLQATINWGQVNRSDLVVELALVHPAEPVERMEYTVVSEAQPLQGGATSFVLPAPQNAPPGPLLPRVKVFDSAGNLVPALTSSGNTRGDLYLRPIWNLPAESWNGEGVQLLNVEAEHLSAESLGVTLHWGVGEFMLANYKLALRLYDLAGRPWAELDTQPSYGFYPSSVWQPGAFFSEHYALTVPYGLPPGDYQLTVSLYDAVSLQPRWGPVQQPFRLWTTAPYDGRPITHQFTPALAAASLSAPTQVEQGRRFDLRVDWVVLDALESLSGRWQLISSEGVVAAEGWLELGDWPAGTFVSGRYPVTLDADLLPGDYRWRLSLADGEPWEAAEIAVLPTTRRFDLPPMQTRVGAEYGDLIRLEGYDLAQSQTSLKLTLYWRALDSIPADYLVFIHLFDPATGQIPVQYDGMTRGYSYPTSQWLNNEVVDDPITLSLVGVPAGNYRLAVGLYQVKGDQHPRLPAVDADDNALPDGRLVLPAEIRVP